MSGQLRMLLRRVAVPVIVAAVLLVGVLVGVPWYYKTYRGALPDRGLTAAEIEWAGAYAPWRSHVQETLARATAHRHSIDGELGRILEEIVACAEDLRVRAGEPPTERLAAVAELAATACTRADAARAEYRAAGDTPSWRTSAMLAGAGDALRGAEFDLRRLLLAQRQLSRRGGPDERTSRVEPLLSEGISADQPTELLCWSEDDWPQVRAELAAIGLERGSALRRDVNAYRFRVHASPRVCETLARFAYAESPAADAGVAQSLLAVLHAAQHAIAGVEDEETAHCEALRRLRTAAARLGAAAEVAEELAAEAAQRPVAGDGPARRCS